MSAPANIKSFRY